MALTLGIIGTLWLLGIPLNPFGEVEKEDPYMVRIPINATPIPAYTRVDRTHMLNPATKRLTYQKLPPSSVIGISIVGVDQNGSHAEDRVVDVKNVDDQVVFVLSGNREVNQANVLQLGGALMNINSIIGRVVKRDKRVGLGFQESTFFPKGTPEGIAGATPIGMRSITLDATKLTGVHALGTGDQIDLLASFPAGGDDGPAASSILTGKPASFNKKDAGEPHLLAQNALVLKPVYIRNEATASSSLTQGKKVQNVPKYEVAIAVNPDDLIPLQRAINQSLTITCIARSMQPSGEKDQLTSVEDPETVMVPVTVRPVLAYNVVTREAFVSSATRTVKVESLPRKQVANMDIITSLDEALGAIARHDIPSGRFLRRSDLLNGPPSNSPAQQNRNAAHSVDPDSGSGFQYVTFQPQDTDSNNSATAVGDRPAITRFIPPGRTAFAIPWNRVYGSEHLQIGDDFDLMVSYSLESKESTEETETRTDGTVIVRKTDSLSTRETERTWGSSFGFRAEPWFVATNAIVIAPVGFPPPASAARALGEQLNRRGNGTGNNELSGASIIIAVEDQDVEAVTAALATRDALFSIGFHSSNAVTETASPKTRQIVVVSEPLAPYEEFNEGIWQGNRRRITSRIVSSDDKRFDDALTVDDVRFYYGRVFGRAKSKGDFLSEADFLPAGTKPGLAAGVKAGFTFLPVSDREIEGLDSFEAEDHVAILIRGVVTKNNSAVGVSSEVQRILSPSSTPNTGVGVSRPVSSVVVADARIARASLAGQTVLSIANQDVTKLQAHLALSNLVAVARPRIEASEASVDKLAVIKKIPDFDPLPKVNLPKIRHTHVIIGGRRTVQSFVVDDSE